MQMHLLRSIRLLMFTVGMLLMSVASLAQISVGLSVTVAPPELPVYDQPECPADGYIWTPGYWSYADDDYYWVPGTWVEPPQPGYLWTPGYWGWGDNAYVFHEGYWGSEVGFYGGIDYGFGYFGHGFEGGRWDNGHFFYNRAVNNVNVTIVHNVYETRVDNRQETRVSFNGGNGGVNVHATSQEEAAGRERHVPPVAAQTQHFQAARSNPELRASANHGKPPIAATARPAEFRGGGAVAAKEGGAVHEAPGRNESNGARPANNANRPAENANRPPESVTRPNTIIHPKDIPAGDRPAAPNTGNNKQDQKYQQQQQKLQSKQDSERQNLQRKQDQDHQRLDQQKANDTQKQQIEQQHQQQTQQLVQKHTQEQQKLQQHQQPAAHPSSGKPESSGKPQKD